MRVVKLSKSQVERLTDGTKYLRDIIVQITKELNDEYGFVDVEQLIRFEHELTLVSIQALISDHMKVIQETMKIVEKE